MEYEEVQVSEENFGNKSGVEDAWESYKDIMLNSDYYKRVMAEMYEQGY